MNKIYTKDIVPALVLTIALSAAPLAVSAHGGASDTAVPDEATSIDMELEKGLDDLSDTEELDKTLDEIDDVLDDTGKDDEDKKGSRDPMMEDDEMMGKFMKTMMDDTKDRVDDMMDEMDDVMDDMDFEDMFKSELMGDTKSDDFDGVFIDGEEMRDMMRDIKTDIELPDSPEDIEDLDDLMKTIGEFTAEDEDIDEVVIDNGEVEVTYKKPARLIGIIPITLTAQVRIDKENNVEVDMPWYAFLVTGDVKRTLQSLEEMTPKEETDNPLKARAEAIFGVFKTLLDA